MWALARQTVVKHWFCRSMLDMGITKEYDTVTVCSSELPSDFFKLVWKMIQNGNVSINHHRYLPFCTCELHIFLLLHQSPFVVYNTFSHEYEIHLIWRIYYEKFHFKMPSRTIDWSILVDNKIITLHLFNTLVNLRLTLSWDFKYRLSICFVTAIFPNTDDSFWTKTLYLNILLVQLLGFIILSCPHILPEIAKIIY